MDRTDHPPGQPTPAPAGFGQDCACGQRLTPGHQCKPVHRQTADVRACRADYDRGATERADFDANAVRYHRDRP